MISYLEKNLAKLPKGNIMVNMGEKLENSQLILIEDFDQSYIINEVEELIGVIKKNNNIKGIDKNKVQTLILMGISGIKYLEKQLLELPHETEILVIEPNKQVLLLELSSFDLSELFERSINIYSGNLDDMSVFLDEYCSGFRLCKFGNLVTFINDLYSVDERTSKWIESIKKGISNKLYSIGNSIQDSLIGIEQNMENIEWFMKSKSTSALKNRFKDIPAIVVSAGPSINKNIELIKQVKDKYIIISVDTMVSKLLQEGIIPHFICSVERIEEVYTYFYKDREYPKEITLVGPSLLRKEVLESFSGEKVLPLRKDVGEYKWLSEILELGEDDFTFMGISCAHVAFGIGVHMGCSPMILVGQDLSFDADGKNTHASGTIYDEKPIAQNDDLRLFEVEGYYGGMVKTTEVWLAFKQWFEKYILTIDTEVINATEGGAKILYTKQFSLKEVIEKYKGQTIDVYEIIKQTESCNVSKDRIIDNLKRERDLITKLNTDLEKQMKVLRGLKIHSKNGGNLEKVRGKLFKTDYLLIEISRHWLLAHLYQSHLVVMLWKYYKIDLAVTKQTLSENIKVQKELIEPILFANRKLLEYIDGAILRLENMIG